MCGALATISTPRFCSTAVRLFSDWLSASRLPLAFNVKLLVCVVSCMGAGGVMIHSSQFLSQVGYSD
jgi:hypothetical protein